jgi:hypothetical protein
MKCKINISEAKRDIKIRDLYGAINKFKNGDQPNQNLVRMTVVNTLQITTELIHS